MAAHSFEKLRSRRRLYVKSVGSFVPKLAQKAFEKYGFSTVALLTNWTAIAGPEFGRYTRPERLRWPRKVAAYRETDASETGRPGAILVLRVDPARALEVQYGSALLIERINGYFGYNAVADIRVLQAPVDVGVMAGGAGLKAAPVAGRERADVANVKREAGVAHPCDQAVEPGLRDALARLQATF